MQIPTMLLTQKQKISIYCLSSVKLDVDKMYWSTVLVKNWEKKKDNTASVYSFAFRLKIIIYFID